MTVVYMSHLVKDKGNARAEIRQPVISVLKGKKLMYVNEVRVLDTSGELVCRIVYNPDGDPSPIHKVSAWVEIMDGSANVEYS